jgi:DNA-binding Lrp family transcriptional regulator
MLDYQGEPSYPTLVVHRKRMAEACWGSRDVFAVVEVREFQELNKLVMDQIQRLIGVRETSTHIT